MVKALKMESVDPVTVTILSGHDESEMLILAPLWKIKLELLWSKQIHI